MRATDARLFSGGLGSVRCPTGFGGRIAIAILRHKNIKE